MGVEVKLIDSGVEIVCDIFVLLNYFEINYNW